jgi:hypothetical protein
MLLTSRRLALATFVIAALLAVVAFPTPPAEANSSKAQLEASLDAVEVRYDAASAVAPSLSGRNATNVNRRLKTVDAIIDQVPRLIAAGRVRPATTKVRHAERLMTEVEAIIKRAAPAPTTTTTVPRATTTTTTTTTTTVPNPPPLGDTIVLYGPVSLSSPTIQEGRTWVLDPNRSTTINVSGDFHVHGTLQSRPASADVVHTIHFVDRGELMVMGAGVLDLQGTPRTAWNRTGSDPTWRAGDELIVTSVNPGDSVAYRPYTPGSRVPSYQGFSAEVANLTRNVIIDNPSRVMLMDLDGRAPQTIRYVTISNAGVHETAGMYALHFHLNGNATRGSIVEGVVVRDAQFRAFVPHGSHGITFRNTLAVDVAANGYWWDLNRSSTPESTIHESNDITYDRAGVIGVRSVRPPDQLRQAGFDLGGGTGNRVIDSFAVGVQGPNSGFHWPEGVRTGVWEARGLVAHNNSAHGVFVWQNDTRQHNVSDLVTYSNGQTGIRHGAYVNSYHYTNVVSVGNPVGIQLDTFSKEAPNRRLTFSCTTISNAATGVKVDHSGVPDGDPVLFNGITFTNVGQQWTVTDKALADGQTFDRRVQIGATPSGC